MDPWDNQYRRRDHRHPSFSSTLLDQIYRSTDSSSSSDVVSMRKKQNRGDENRVCLEKILANRRKTADENRVCLEKILVNRRKTADDLLRSKHSSSSSSDSSGFSSSESDSFYRRTRSSRSSPPEIHHPPPKPIRTTTVERLVERPNNNNNNNNDNNNNNKVKLKALKMYSDLKKVKQPLSPGGRVATFLNSLFTAGNNTKKKPNKTATSASTTCSSSSSFSRSCLSKTTTSSNEKSKRSVRFTVDEKSTRESRVMEENRRVIEAAKELIRTYQKSKDVVVNIEEEEDDDAASCASSDLFELDNIWAIGIERYREELPVYETTRPDTNRIISR